ncbi:ABC-type cobalt transport system, permease [Corynebacterium glutamicum MT]|uniref:Cobalt ABC transporter permease n=1 Tax=Corynebacterium glutamicum TaxID=1718 RepID=A0AB36IBV5_CORGT|nr:energy-coupling factor transporter transmembrane component T [Corynebacterium glutamicum]AGN21254.1 ABC-type cobalt transport system, permease [Corynebacterium glutamicum SCgG2]EGV41516.1 cobalt/nickel transport system permease protein [Corynebacterium glutamicum S9114]EOA63651.1 ABC-type cobalt transport system, permease [Corynebacterium glutamicum MT]OKX80133.1 cobalt ABC transporter permease [Corynebacterium glutamicum]OKX80937.1 cobalt ABC transporter permease [Corynebacterium glutamicu
MVHPWAWWVWALGIAGCASMTNNPYILALTFATLCFVVFNRRGSSPWSRAFPIYLMIAGWLVLYRLVMHVVVGAKIGSIELFRIPPVQLPEWAAGIHVFGTVYLEGLIIATTQGLTLGTMIVAVGAANSLADPKKLLKSLPGALGELGTAVVIGISIAPQMAESAFRINRARTLRGDDAKGVRGFARILMPVFQDTLDRSLALANSMDSRGYGRQAHVSKFQQRVTSIFGALGILGVTVGLFVVLDASSPMFVAVPVFITGVGFLIISLVVASRRKTSTTFDQLPWGAAEWLVCITGVIPLLMAALTRYLDPGSMITTWVPLHVPDTVPLLVVAGLVVATMPGFLTPRLPRNKVRVKRRKAINSPERAEV